MAEFQCEVCNFIFNEEIEKINWEDLKDDWMCPVCGSPKNYFKPVDGLSGIPDTAEGLQETDETGQPDVVLRHDDKLEIYMTDIHRMAETGESISEPMRTTKPTISWDDILIKGAQLAKIPLNPDDPVNTQTIIGPKAKQPLIIDTPIYITHMSFGALSK
ncbi:FMN-binding glutamate synthase family protein, partial [Desulfobacteraceae bacterium SEEP-SAG9]